MLYRIDVILASSRGEGARRTHQTTPYSPHKLTAISSSRATMHTLLNKAINILAHAPNPHDYHIYIIGGYCDINERISYPLHYLRNSHNRRAQYEEYIFREKPNSSSIASQRPRRKSFWPNTFSTRPSHHLHHTTKSRLMEPHSPQTTQNSHAPVLTHIPSHAK